MSAYNQVNSVYTIHKAYKHSLVSLHLQTFAKYAQHEPVAVVLEDVVLNQSCSQI